MASLPARRLSVEQQAKRLKVLRLFNQDLGSVCVQEARLFAFTRAPDVSWTCHTLSRPSESSSENSVLRLAIPEVRYSLSKYIYPTF